MESNLERQNKYSNHSTTVFAYTYTFQYAMIICIKYKSYQLCTDIKVFFKKNLKYNFINKI